MFTAQNNCGISYLKSSTTLTLLGRGRWEGGQGSGPGSVPTEGLAGGNVHGVQHDCMSHFAKPPVKAPYHLCRLSAEAGHVKRLLHFSDMGADPQHASKRMQTKAQGDAEVLKAFPKATIFR